MNLQLVPHHLETSTPLDPIHFVTRGEKLVALDFGSVDGRLMRLLRRRFGDDVACTPAKTSHTVSGALQAYLRREYDALDAIPIDDGGTPFQKRVWAALRLIPAGQTSSYGEIASQLGMRNGARAVGLANSLNPFNLIVPCHRLIGRDGALTGYGGGIDRKRWLLVHEQGSIGASDGALPLFPHL